MRPQYQVIRRVYSGGKTNKKGEVVVPRTHFDQLEGTYSTKNRAEEIIERLLENEVLKNSGLEMAYSVIEV